MGLHVKLRGIDFAVTAEKWVRPLTDLEDILDREIYVWNCKTQKGRTIGARGNPPMVYLPPIVIFYEKTGRKHDKAKSATMMAKFLAASDATSMIQVRKSAASALGALSFPVPTAAYAEFNPLVSYSLDMDVGLMLFKLTNVAKGIRLYVLLPVTAEISMSVLDICDAAGLKNKLKQQANALDKKGRMNYPPDGGTELNRQFRLASYEEMLEELEEDYEDAAEDDEEGEEARELDKEIEKLEDLIRKVRRSLPSEDGDDDDDDDDE